MIKQISSLSSTTLTELPPAVRNQIISMTLMDTSSIILMKQATEGGEKRVDERRMRSGTGGHVNKDEEKRGSRRRRGKTGSRTKKKEDKRVEKKKEVHRREEKQTKMVSLNWKKLQTSILYREGKSWIAKLTTKTPKHVKILF